ncbi:MAG: FAD-dependent oxidoreductase [Clostridium butyricum]|nr:FAD-dependent oxidoreductase [Clostridium butyricum]
MDYDVLILGGGIIGCAVAYELSKYNINIALIEKDYDIASDIYFVNTAVIYDGSETADNIMANLEYLGQGIIEAHCNKFGIPYEKVGSLQIGNYENLDDKLEYMNSKAKERGIRGVKIIDQSEIYDIEPNLKSGIRKALYSENTAVIPPYDLATSYAEIAADNGVSFRLEEVVMDIKNISNGFKITTNKNKFTCKFVVNTIPDQLFSDRQEETSNNVVNKKLNYILCNEKIDNKINTVIVNNLNEKSFVINIPINPKGCLIGIKEFNELDLDEAFSFAKTVQNLDKGMITNIFTEEYTKDSMFIDDSDIDVGYIRVTGSHYGKITIAPAIAKIIEDRLTKNMNIVKKKDYIDKKRDVYTFRNMTKEEQNDIIALDKRYGNIICSCNNVSEGEIIDCIRRPLGARTLEGVKRRTGVGIGKCNGANCNMKIIKILANEMNTSPLNIVDNSMNSKILTGRIKEFNEI